MNDASTESLHQSRLSVNILHIIDYFLLQTHYHYHHHNISNNGFYLHSTSIYTVNQSTKLMKETIPLSEEINIIT
jgi:hypothetical protein